jgi:hypothetical protein
MDFFMGGYSIHCNAEGGGKIPKQPFLLARSTACLVFAVRGYRTVRDDAKRLPWAFAKRTNNYFRPAIKDLYDPFLRNTRKKNGEKRGRVPFHYSKTSPLFL